MSDEPKSKGNDFSIFRGPPGPKQVTIILAPKGWTLVPRSAVEHLLPKRPSREAILNYIARMKALEEKEKKHE
jgi:hypothetical protein